VNLWKRVKNKLESRGTQSSRTQRNLTSPKGSKSQRQKCGWNSENQRQTN